ncbi:ABC transporter ATP-binding protein [Williamsia sp. 1135]|uniref:ABC transporter ATP-binding protein n=1 Tax=Williamsia sp. 1135 TaxID=1889262 RepID=UPI000A117FF7|nr:ABC transporter ATP-binding protein [Williamsia sp. 1135]ORM34923.1 ABC transporter ATP-binding protein [Williamsia sp. 1135]
MTTTAIELSGLTKTFASSKGPVRAVNGIDLRIGAGEIVAFLGPNGAGKTSTIDMMLGLSSPDSGTVRVFGTDPVTAAGNGRIAAVMQTGGLLPDFTVAETVRIVAGTFGAAAAVDGVVERARLTDIADRKVSKCSGGEQQRLKFALALLPDPDLIVLDEPTAGMDVESRRAFWATMRADAQSGRTVVFATHYLEEADDFADRIVMVAKGQIVADGSTASIRAQASGRTVSAVLDRNDLATVRAAFPELTDVTERGGRHHLRTPDSDALARHLLTATGARDVEITSHNLEDAFVVLTSDHQQNATPERIR